MQKVNEIIMLTSVSKVDYKDTRFMEDNWLFVKTSRIFWESQSFTKYHGKKFQCNESLYKPKRAFLWLYVILFVKFDLSKQGLKLVAEIFFVIILVSN